MAEFTNPLLRAWEPTCSKETRELLSGYPKGGLLETPSMVFMQLIAALAPPKDCAELACAIDAEIKLLDKVRQVVATPGISEDTATVMALHTLLGVDRG